MKSITFYGEGRSKRGTLHIEVPGAIVNIDVGLSDSDGNPVTRVEIKADDISGERFYMPDLPSEDGRPRQHIAVRVLPLPAVKPDERTRDWNSGYHDGQYQALENSALYPEGKRRDDYLAGYRLGFMEASEGGSTPAQAPTTLPRN